MKDDRLWGDNIHQATAFGGGVLTIFYLIASRININNRANAVDLRLYKAQISFYVFSVRLTNSLKIYILNRLWYNVNVTKSSLSLEFIKTIRQSTCRFRAACRKVRTFSQCVALAMVAGNARRHEAQERRVRGASRDALIWKNRAPSWGELTQ